MDSEVKAVEVSDKKEAALDTLFPKPEASSGSTPVEALPLAGVGTGSCEAAEQPLSSQINTLRAVLAERVEKLNIANVKDGSRSDVAAVHGTRLIQRFNVLDEELESFANFLAKEGHE